MDKKMFDEIQSKLKEKQVMLIAVSKTKPVEDILEIYNEGHKIFGENKVQELTAKYEELPKDIEWHMIGHLQRNKVKYVAPFVAMIHSVDSLKLLKEINKQARNNERVINCLLQIHIAREETKFGLSEEELHALLDSQTFKELHHIKICGLMGMATYTVNKAQVRQEFKQLKDIFLQTKRKYFPDDAAFKEISMGMSEDYELAVKESSTMVRIGSLIFGERNLQ